MTGGGDFASALLFVTVSYAVHDIVSGPTAPITIVNTLFFVLVLKFMYYLQTVYNLQMSHVLPSYVGSRHAMLLFRIYRQRIFVFFFSFRSVYGDRVFRDRAVYLPASRQTA